MNLFLCFQTSVLSLNKPSLGPHDVQDLPEKDHLPSWTDLFCLLGAVFCPTV